ncbi:MAG: polyamine aminopropyltransferase [Eubacteriales bacterium]|nr:polyamine aminopropyltransferase [Eubacteriales bacterium]MDD3572920.1 polyamine aminopropyltransferase [Eubacteriales bacterium]MDD4133843.1 polyamine aminopropyltransferase [Eubacteriales bacterium]
MAFWFSESHTDNVKLEIKVNEQLYSRMSDYQKIDIFQSEEFGRILTLDDIITLTEKDEFIYHEMIVHPAMAVHPSVRRVLVVGAGDGGALRELIRYEDIESIDLVEIDGMLVDACREFLPSTAVGYSDPRVRVHIQDGLKFIRRLSDTYDLIIVDSTDPFGPGEILFTKEFYGNCYKALRDHGIMVNQHESPFYSYEATAMKRAHKRIKESFPVHSVYQAHIPSYPSGHWLFGFASITYEPLKDLNALRWNERGIKTRYYNTDLHRGAFYLPNYVKEMLGE